MKKVAVTGAYGLLGSDVVKSLLEEKYEVIAFPSHAELDLANYEKTKKFVHQHQPEVIVHLAANPSPDAVERDPAQGWKDNFDSTYNLVRILNETGGVMCYGSTDSVFSGHGAAGPYHEFSNTSPLNEYGQTKFASEQIIRQQMERYFILRLPFLFGLGGKPEKNRLLGIIQKAKAGEKVVLSSDSWSSACATRDVGQAIGKIIRTEKWGTYHLAGEPSVSRTGLMRYFLEQMGLDAGIVEETNYVEAGKLARRAHYSVMTSILLEATFGFRMPSWKTGMQEYVKELKKRGI